MLWKRVPCLFPFTQLTSYSLRPRVFPGVRRKGKKSKVTSLRRVILSRTTVHQVLNRFLILREGRRDEERQEDLNTKPTCFLFCPGPDVIACKHWSQDYFPFTEYSCQCSAFTALMFCIQLIFLQPNTLLNLLKFVIPVVLF